MSAPDAWRRSLRQRRRRLLTAVLLSCLLLLLCALVAAARWQLYRSPRLVGPEGGRYLVARFASPVSAEPTFVLCWQEEDRSWSPVEHVRGRYVTACHFQGLLYVFFDDGSYSSYRKGEHVERSLFPFQWLPLSVVGVGDELWAFGGEGESHLRVARQQAGEWKEGQSLPARVVQVANVEAVAVGGEALVCWQEAGKEGERRGVFYATCDGRDWEAASILTLKEVNDIALGTLASGDVYLVLAEPDPKEAKRQRFLERRWREGVWLSARPLRFEPAFSGRVLEISMVPEAGEPTLLVNRAGALECYVRRDPSWTRVEVLASSGRPAGLGSRGWLLVSVGALAVLAVAGALLFTRGGAAEQRTLHAEIVYASLLERGVACGFDAVLTLFCVLVVSGLDELETTALIATAVHVAYGTVLEARWGMTVGKRLVGIVVVTPELEAIGPSRSLLRNLARVVDSFPAYLIGVGSILASRRRQRVGDRLAGTVVLRESALLVPRAATLREVPTDADAEGRL